MTKPNRGKIQSRIFQGCQLGCITKKSSCNNCIKQGRVCEGYGSLWVEPLGPSTQTFQVTPTTPAKPLRRNGSKSPHLPSPSPSPHDLDGWKDAQLSPVSASPSGSSLSPLPHTIGEKNTPQSQQDDNEYTEHATALQSSLAVVPRPRNYVPHLSGHESHYIQYHVLHGSRLLANLESEDNPLRSLLIPRAMSSPLLMKAVCAMSALHLSNRSQGFTAQTASADYYGQTLNELRSVLVKCPPELLSDNAMIAVGLLCKYEIVRGSVKQWVVHLNALQRLITTRGGLRSMEQDAAHFLRGL